MDHVDPFVGPRMCFDSLLLFVIITSVWLVTLMCVISNWYTSCVLFMEL